MDERGKERLGEKESEWERLKGRDHESEKDLEIRRVSWMGEIRRVSEKDYG